MMPARLRRAAPFALTAAVGLYLWFLTGEFDTGMSAGRIGPAAWPRIVLALLLGAALLGLLQATLRPTDLDRSLGAALTAGSGSEGNAGETRPSNLRALAGIALLAAFPVAVPWLGFLATSVLVIFGQMWIGGYRKPVRAGTIAFIGTFVLFLVFQRFVYLSLPLGAGPFAEFTKLVMSILGVR
jgi:putative tricarboxylic transport membrane protein